MLILGTHIVDQRSDMKFKGILHHLSKYQINWPSLRNCGGQLFCFVMFRSRFNLEKTKNTNNILCKNIKIFFFRFFVLKKKIQYYENWHIIVILRVNMV